jgi:hypothetical protein
LDGGWERAYSENGTDPAKVSRPAFSSSKTMYIVIILVSEAGYQKTPALRSSRVSPVAASTTT